MPKSRRNILKAGGIGVALSLAGCLGDDDGGGDDGTGDGGSDDGTGDGGSDDGSTDDGGSDDPITFGILYPGVIPDGDLTLNGAEYAIEEINAEGGLLGREVEMVTADTQLDPETAGEEGRRLIEQEDVDFLSGGFATGPILAVQNRIAGTGPVFCASSVGGTQPLDRINQQYDQFKYFFSPVPVGPLVVDTMAWNMENTVQEDTGLDSVVPVIEDHAWTEGFVPRLEAATDMNVEEPVQFPIDTSDFSPVFSQVREADAELMMLGLAVANGPGFVTQWAENEVPAAMTGILVAANAPNFIEQVGSAAEGVGQQQLGGAAPITEVSLPFVEGYRETFNSEPGTTAWQTYDAVTSIFAAVEEAGTIDDDAVTEALENIKIPGTMGMLDYMGVDSDFPHNAVMDPDDGVWYTHLQYQREEGELKNKIVGPDQWADYDGEEPYQLPPWM